MKRNVLWLAIVAEACAFAAAAPLAESKTLTACPAGATHRQCGFHGGAGLQRAIDQARDGDRVLLKSGTYAPDAFRDTPYKKYVIRGFLTLDRKDIELVGEPGAVLDGSTGPATTAIVVNGGRVAVRSLTIRNFRAVDPMDDLYDGSGIYVLDADVLLNGIVVDRHGRNGIVGRGTSLITAADVRVENGYVGILQVESSYLRLCNSIVRNNRAAGLAAYANSLTAIYNSVFDGNLDDGLYGVGSARIFATNSLILNNKPYAVRVGDDARATVDHSVLFGNEARFFTPAGTNLVAFGAGVREGDPGIQRDYRLQADTAGDPDVREPSGALAKVGLGPVAACANAPGRP